MLSVRVRRDDAVQIFIQKQCLIDAGFKRPAFSLINRMDDHLCPQFTAVIKDSGIFFLSAVIHQQNTESFLYEFPGQLNQPFIRLVRRYQNHRFFQFV